MFFLGVLSVLFFQQAVHNCFNRMNLLVTQRFHARHQRAQPVRVTGCRIKKFLGRHLEELANIEKLAIVGNAFPFSMVLI